MTHKEETKDVAVFSVLGVLKAGSREYGPEQSPDWGQEKGTAQTHVFSLSFFPNLRPTFAFRTRLGVII